MKEFALIIPIMSVLQVQTRFHSVRGEALGRVSGEESSFIICPFQGHRPVKPIRFLVFVGPNEARPSPLLFRRIEHNSG